MSSLDPRVADHLALDSEMMTGCLDKLKEEGAALGLGRWAALPLAHLLPSCWEGYSEEQQAAIGPIAEQAAKAWCAKKVMGCVLTNAI